MKITLFLWATCLPFFLKGQLNKSGRGIHFEQELSWKQVVDKAKKENKYIFLDCFTSWCGPCKTMDSLVFSSKDVGDAYNNTFVSVKVQMDKTTHDDSLVRKWYKDAQAIQSIYSINAFPSFLFFSPDGHPVHKVIGYHSPQRFIALAGDAKNPQKQFYTVAKNFQPGKLDTAEMKALVYLFYPLDKALAGKIAADYLSRVPRDELDKPSNLAFMAQFASRPEVLRVALNYTSKLPEEKRYEKEVIMLLSKITKSPQDLGFDMFYRHPDKVDAITNLKGFGQRTSDNIIYVTEILPALQAASADTVLKEAVSPDFDAIAASIEKKYDKGSAERNILTAKIKWYAFFTKKYDKSWQEYGSYFIEQVEKDGYDSTIHKMNVFVLNNTFWDVIFIHSTDTRQLTVAAECMKKVVEQAPGQAGLLDTYANLLYKVGRKEEALVVQSKACEMAPRNRSLRDALDKMKNGEPTWPYSK